MPCPDASLPLAATDVAISATQGTDHANLSGPLATTFVDYRQFMDGAHLDDVESRCSQSSLGSTLSIGSLASLVSVGSIASLASVGSIASIGSVGSIASVGKCGAVFNYPVTQRLVTWAWHRFRFSRAL